MPYSLLLLFSYLRLGLPSGLFPSGLRTKALYSPLLSPRRATCPADLTRFDLVTQAEKQVKVIPQQA